MSVSPSSSSDTLQSDLSYVHSLMEEENIRLYSVVSCFEAPEAEERYKKVLEEGRYGQMDFLSRHENLKYRPDRLMPECKSIIFIAVPYYLEGVSAAGCDECTSAGRQGEPAGRDKRSPAGGDKRSPAGGEVAPAGRIARYARGRDYHKTLKGKLRRIIAGLKARYPEGGFRPFVDSGPIDERYYAAGSIGFIGRHGLLLTRAYGTWFFLGEILSNIAFPERPGDTRCVSQQTIEMARTPGGFCPPGCRACIDACPVSAIGESGKFYPERCISYLTIEHEGPIAEELKPLIGERLFGCDTCQEVCPFNRVERKTETGGTGGNRPEPSHLEGSVADSEEIVSAIPEDFTRSIAGKWVSLEEVYALETREDMTARFAGSPLMRCSLAQLKRNANIVEENLRENRGDRGER